MRETNWFTLSLLTQPHIQWSRNMIQVKGRRGNNLTVVAKSHQLHCEIFDSERWRWEKIECSPPYGETVTNCSPSVTTAVRFVHWLTLENSVLTLDVEKRRFRCSALPGCLPECRWTLVEYEGGLGFMCRVEQRDRSDIIIVVWSKGEKKAVVNMRDIMGVDLHHHPVAVEFCSSNVVFVRSLKGSGFYNMQNRSFSKVEVPCDLRILLQVFRFRSDLHIVDLKGARQCHASQHKKNTVD